MAKAQKTKPVFSQAATNIYWVETTLRYPDGPLIGKRFKLMEWQKEIFYLIYDNQVPTRQAIISFARKNGKTTLMAVLLLLHLVGPMAKLKPGTRCYSAARTREQASEVFNYAAMMIAHSELLTKYTKVTAHRKRITCPKLKTSYQALSADKIGALGRNVAFAIHDELGAVKTATDDLYTNIEYGMGAQKNPLSLVISTQAKDDNALLSLLIDGCKENPQPNKICILHTADGLVNDKGEPIDPLSIEGLRAANPALGQFLYEENLMHDLTQALNQPSEIPAFKNFQLNMRVPVDDGKMINLVRPENWENCIGKLPDIHDCDEVYAGLDLSHNRDMTAVVCIGIINGDPHYYAYPKLWLPRVGLEERGKSLSVDLAYWADMGWLTTCPGENVKYLEVVEYIKYLFDNTNLKKIAYDDWRYNMFCESLSIAGFQPWQYDKEVGTEHTLLFEKFPMAGKGMDTAINTFEKALIEKELVHDDHKVLTYCALATQMPVTIDTGGRRFSKKRNKHFIDGTVALTMALQTAKDNQTEIRFDPAAKGVGEVFLEALTASA